MTGTREHLGQACADALPHGIGVGKDDDAALLVGGADVLDRRTAETESVGDDAVRLHRSPHRPHIHLSLNDDNFFNQRFTLFTMLSAAQILREDLSQQVLHRGQRDRCQYISSRRDFLRDPMPQNHS